MRSIIQSSGKIGIIALLALVVTGCASVPTPYRPAQVGLLPGGEPTGDLLMTLRPDQNSAKIGDQITFSIILKNMGKQVIWIPVEPRIVLTWIYPDGRCDNFVGDDESTATVPALAPLAPGEERRFRPSVTTQYFAHSGITEFRALISVPQCSRNAPGRAWSGEMASNGYGVMFVE